MCTEQIAEKFSRIIGITSTDQSQTHFCVISVKVEIELKKWEKTRKKRFKCLAEVGASKAQTADYVAKKEMSEPYLFHIRIVALNPCDKHAGGIHQFR